MHILNNIVEQDHGFIKKRIVDGLGLNEFESAKRKLPGMEMVDVFKSFYSLVS